MKPWGTIFALLCGAGLLVAQEVGPDVNKYIGRIEEGQGDKVRDEVPALMKRYPNNPGVLYLQGLTTNDGAEAVRIYQSIVDNFPKSEWADAALYKIYQFYYAIGLYRTAELKLDQLRKDYPASRYLARVEDVDTKKLAEEQQPVLRAPATQERESKAEPVTETAAEPVPKREPQAGTVPKREEKIVPPLPLKAEAPTQKAETPTSTETTGRFRLQLGAFSTQENAEKERTYLDKLGITSEIVPRERGGKTLYCVLVGRFATASEARSLATQLKQKHDLASMVVSQ